MREGTLTKVAVGAGVGESDIQTRTRRRWQKKQKTLDWIQLVSMWRLVSQLAVAITDWGGFPQWYTLPDKKVSYKKLSAWNGFHFHVEIGQTGKQTVMQDMRGWKRHLWTWKRNRGGRTESRMYWRMFAHALSVESPIMQEGNRSLACPSCYATFCLC